MAEFQEDQYVLVKARVVWHIPAAYQYMVRFSDGSLAMINEDQLQNDYALAAEADVRKV